MKVIRKLSYAPEYKDFDREPLDEPPDDRRPIDEIKTFARSLTYGEMMEVRDQLWPADAEMTRDSFPALFWKWAGS